MTDFEFKRSEEKRKEDSLHINYNKGKVTGYVTIFKFTDKDTLQSVLYAPSFNLSSYGKDHLRALEMMKESLHDLIDSYLQLSPSKLQQELRSLGWKRNRLRSKDFSRAEIDVEGNLRNFNAADNKVERFALVA